MNTMDKRVNREILYLLIFLISTLSIVGITGFGVFEAMKKLTSSVDDSRYPFQISMAVHQIESRLDLLEDSIQLAVSDSDTESAKVSFFELEEFLNGLDDNFIAIKNSGEVEQALLIKLELDINELNNFLQKLPDMKQEKVVDTEANIQILIYSGIIESQIREILSKVAYKTSSLIDDATIESKVFIKKAELFFIIVFTILVLMISAGGVISFIKNKHIFKQQNKAEEANKKLSLALDGTRAGIWDWEVKTGKITLNERWAEMLGYTLEELTPASIDTWRKLAFEPDLEKSNAKLKKHFSGESEYYECEIRMHHKDGHLVWIWDKGKVVEWDEKGEPIRMIGTHVDITEMIELQEKLRQSLEEKTYLLSEIHHRVKNNLAIISGLMELQSFSSKDEKVKKALQTNLKRIKSMALIHEDIYNSENFSEICLSRVIKEEMESLLADINYSSGIKADILYDMEVVKININQAIPLSMLINEIFNSEYLNNTFIPILRSIKVSLRELAGIRRLTLLFNNAVANPGGKILSQSDIWNDLIGAFLTQIRGTLVVEHSTEGFKFIIEFKGEKVNGSAGNLVAV